MNASKDSKKMGSSGDKVNGTKVPSFDMDKLFDDIVLSVKIIIDRQQDTTFESIKSILKEQGIMSRLEKAIDADTITATSSYKYMEQDLSLHQIELSMQNEELQMSNRELDASKKRYFDLYDLAPVGYCTIDKDGNILNSNLTISAMLGTKRQDLGLRVFNSFIYKDDVVPYLLWL